MINLITKIIPVDKSGKKPASQTVQTGPSEQTQKSNGYRDKIYSYEFNF